MNIQPERIMLYGCQYHQVSFTGFMIPQKKQEMAEWCHHTLGPHGHNYNTYETRWLFYNNSFLFSREQDLTMFILRWS